MIQPEISDRAERLFLAAVDLPPQELSEFLDKVCKGELKLREEVDALLASDRASTGAISDVVRDEAELLFESGSHHLSLTGERLGSYRVVREIGHGGMGAVYLATRDDDQFRKQVAIKVVKRGMDTAEVLARFRRERQILANLDHPYIARLLDAGTTADGRPFFVMEYVEGQSIDAFCRENVLSTSAICRLFLRVCQAVAHAHRNLIVHRDLKPGNILVAADGTPKLLDFGVAKLLSDEFPGDFTAPSLARPFTPEYASPEQVVGAAVTTATDVYALGAIFFELLTGQRAQPLVAHTPEDIRRAVCETEIQPPSQIARHLDADLDNIVLMAMRKEPARRYAGVDQLASDIERHLEGWPINARQDSFVYRSQKFARRYALQVIAVALVFASLVTGIAISIAQSRRADTARRIAEEERTVALAQQARAESQSREASRARDEAQRERARAEQRVSDLIELANRSLFDVHDAIASLPGAVTARQQIVKTTLDYLERLEKEAGLDDRMRMVLSQAYYRIGMIQGDPQGPSLQQFEAARVSFNKAEAMLAPLYRAKSNDPDLLVRRIETEASLAEIEYRQGHAEAAIDGYAKILSVAHRLGQLRPADAKAAKQESAMEARLAQLYSPTDPARALDLAKKEVALLQNLISRFPQDAGLKQELGAGFGNLAGRLVSVGELEQAAVVYQNSIEMRQKLVAADPNNVVVRRGLLVSYGNYAALLGIPWSANLGRTADAREYAAKAVAVARELAAADAEDGTARYDLAVALSRQGEVDPEPDRIAESLATLKEAVGIMESFMKANPKSATIALQLALAREYVGHRLEGLGQTDESAAQFRQSLAEAESFVNSGSAGLVIQEVASSSSLARLYASLGDRDRALEFARRAIALAEPDFAAHHAETGFARMASAYFALASVERDLGEWTQAREAAEKGLDLFRSVHNVGLRSIFRRDVEQTESLLLQPSPHTR